MNKSQQRDEEGQRKKESYAKKFCQNFIPRDFIHLLVEQCIPSKHINLNGVCEVNCIKVGMCQRNAVYVCKYSGVNRCPWLPNFSFV